jgi:endoglucanase
MSKRHTKKGLVFLLSVFLLFSSVVPGIIFPGLQTTVCAAGENLLVNGDFESGLDHYSIWWGDVTASPDGGMDGSKALKMVGSGGGARFNIPLEADKSYTFTASASLEDGASVTLILVDGGGNNPDVDITDTALSFTESGGWKTKTVTFTVPEDASSDIFMKFANSDSTAYIDNISLAADDGGGTQNPPLPTNPAYAINYHYQLNPVPYSFGNYAIPAGGAVGVALDVEGTDRSEVNPETQLVYAFKVVPRGTDPDEYGFINLDKVTPQGVKISRHVRPWGMSAAFTIQTEGLLTTASYDIWPYVMDAEEDKATWLNRCGYPVALTIVGLNDPRMADQPNPELKEAGAVDKNIIALNIQEGTVCVVGQTNYTFTVGESVRVEDVQNKNIHSVDGQYRGKLAVDNNEVYAAVGSEPEKRYVAQRGDIINCVGADQFELVRNNAPAGRIRMVNPKLWVPETIQGKPVNRCALEKTDTFSVSEGGNAVTVNKVYRKEKANNKAISDNGYTFDHWVFLELAEALKDGATYTVTLNNNLLLSGRNVTDNVIAFTHNSRTNRSDAIHVSHTGFKPSDGVKKGFLSIWLGSGNEHIYNVNAFNLINTQTGQVAYTGNVNLIRAYNEVEEMSPNSMPYENTARTNVYGLDFSDFKTAGKYVIQIDGIGTSYPFEIGEKVWEEVYKISMNGLYYNRSEITIDFNGYSRPRSYHPDNGAVVYQATVGLFETGNGLDASGRGQGNFNQLIESRTEHTLRGDAIWGGYYDAADWDKRIQHLQATRAQLELMLMYPGKLDGIDMGLPDSALVYNNYTLEDMEKAELKQEDTEGIPDALAECLWNLDYYRRLQVLEEDWIPDGRDWLGGIRGGMEATDHPVWGEASWQDSLVLMTYAPDAWTSYIYASAAARTSHILKDLGKNKLAKLYKESAIKAYEYAERDFAANFGPGKPGANWTDGAQKAVISEKALAEVELYRLTNIPAYHAAFKNTMNTNGYGAAAGKLFDKDNRPTWLYEFQSAIFAYIILPSHMADSPLVEEYKTILLGYDENPRKAYGSAAHALAYMDRNTWGISMWDEGVPLMGYCSPYSTPHADTIIRAHYITGDSKYRDAVVKATQFALGANQDNMAQTTGVGYEYPKNTLHLESRQTGQANPPGITIYGAYRFDTLPYWPITIPHYAYPHILPHDTYSQTGNRGLSNWPTAESILDIFLYPASQEWTIHQTMGPAAYTWGYLAVSGDSTEGLSMGKDKK